MDNPLSKLKLDYWYHAIMAVCAVGIVIALTVQTKGITNAQALFLFGGGFFVGLGEWKNHPLQMTIKHPTRFEAGYTTSGYHRSGGVIGYGFVLLGVALFGVSIYKILHD